MPIHGDEVLWNIPSKAAWMDTIPGGNNTGIGHRTEKIGFQFGIYYNIKLPAIHIQQS